MVYNFVNNYLMKKNFENFDFEILPISIFLYGALQYRPWSYPLLRNEPMVNGFIPNIYVPVSIFFSDGVCVWIEFGIWR